MAKYFLNILHFIVILFMSNSAIAQEDTTQFIYKGFDRAGLQIDGSAKLHPNGLLQLTNTTHVVMGHAFYRFPLKFNSTSSQDLSFSTNFVVAMVPELETNTSGHGIVFVISPSMDFSQATQSQFLGVFNLSTVTGLSSNHIFAVELDTIKSPEFKDIDDNHVGIDVNSLFSNASASAAYYLNGKNESFLLIDRKPIHVWIDYDGEEKLVNVTLAPTSISKPVLPLLSTRIDLSLILLDYMYVGFSSSTGSTANNHYILGWSFNKSGQSQSLEISELPLLPLPPPSPPSPPPTTTNSNLNVILTIIVIIAVLCMSVGVAAYIIRRKRYEETLEDWEKDYGPQRFSYKDLYKATKGFKASEILGEGGFGKVYKGLLASSKEHIAVKRISHRSPQGLQEFIAEIVSMGRLSQRNLVQLRGYCRKGEDLLLVYEYMPNGSLDTFLYSNEKPTLPWLQRFQILKDISSALFYLHEEWEKVVLHRDVKASNVMLDADMNGRLGDFGLARTYDHGFNPTTTLVGGTVGYLAPEVSRTGQATTSTDIYAFGVFMLEMACGRKPVDNRFPEELELIKYVIKAQRKGNILEVCDPKLKGNYVVEEMELVLKLGLLCCDSEPALRPSTRQVAQYLRGEAYLREVDIPTDDAGVPVLAPHDEITAELIMSFELSHDEVSDHSLSSTDSILCGTL